MSSMVESEKQRRNWLDLPPELTSTILLKLDTAEILTGARNVCSSWRKICKNPNMWRVINTHTLRRLSHMDLDLFQVMCTHAVDLSSGLLLDINLEYFGTDELLQYISQSSNQLRRLKIVECIQISGEGLIETVSKLPLLETLEIFVCYFNVETLRTVGKCCPLLKSLKLNKHFHCLQPWEANDEEARAIAETMPMLRYLQIFGNGLTNEGLQTILDGCPFLESLDLRNCLNLDLKGPLRQKCAQTIKILFLPHDDVDHIDDYELANLFCFD